MPRPLRARFVVAALAAASSASCSQQRASPAAALADSSATAPASAVPSEAGLAMSADADAGSDGPWIGATVLQAPIMSEMEWPAKKEADRGDHEVRSTRIGYLRYGERTAVLPEPHRKPNCPDGWYELVAGGFICSKYATLDLDHPRYKLAKPPDLDGPLPYTYGVNMANGTPLYRQVPSRQERAKLEPWLVRPRKAKTEDDNPYGPDAGAADAAPIGENAGDSGIEAPWWEKESPDGGPPAVTLDDLQESGFRRMVKGFYLSLDHTFPASGSTFWKTVGGLSAPADRILVAKPLTDYHGVWLGKDAATFATKNVPARRIDKLPIAFILMRNAKRWTLDAGQKHVQVADGALDRFDAIGLTGEKARVAGVDYWETDEGWWLRAVDGTTTEPSPPPDKLGEHEKWIDVNLKRQTLVAFEGTTPTFATVVSSGRNEHETPPGSFHIREKHIAATMDGDADTAADGPYSIEDVPYIEYFNGGYALHGAFWHASFGGVKSHGCVNLAPWDAKALFGWTDPQLPDGWHAVFANKDHPGTRVIVHEKGPGTCQGPLAQPPQCP